MSKHFYVFVRTDLSLEQQLVQAVHAAYESGIRHGDRTSIDSVVVCQARDEFHLKQILNRLTNLQIPLVGFYEPDIGNQLTAISTSPLDMAQRKSMSKYRLWKGQ